MKKIKIMFGVSFVVLLSFIFILFSCGDENPTPDNKPDNLTYFKIFAVQSIFYDSIGANPEIDPNSGNMLKSLVEQVNSQGFFITVKEWTTPVYFADLNTEKQDVKMTVSWTPKKYLKNVPIPEWAEPDPSGDGHMVIIDTIGGCVYDFWGCIKGSRGWKSSWGNALPLDGNGIFPNGLSCRGSGFELLQGLIWPQELIKGEIKHALIFSYDHTKDGGPVLPATESDGTENNNEAIPEGALVQLNPALDLSQLGLTDYEMTVAKALQKYGMYCADDGGGLSLYAINPISCKNNPYTGVLPDDIQVYLTKIPVDQFRILKMPPQYEPLVELVSNSCAIFD